MLREQTKEEQRRVLEGKRKALDAQIAAMRSEFEQEEARVTLAKQQGEQREREVSQDMQEMDSLRRGARQGKAAIRNGRVGVVHES
jgi:hypothetical protein